VREEIGHLASDKHNWRTQNPNWYGPYVVNQDGAPALPDARYDKPWFEMREGEWHCLLCNLRATEGHLTSRKHTMREAAPSVYSYNYPATTPVMDLPLPPGWEMHKSNQHQSLVYYYNTDTGEKQWARPVVAMLQQSKPNSPTYHTRNSGAATPPLLEDAMSMFSDATTTRVTRSVTTNVADGVQQANRTVAKTSDELLPEGWLRLFSAKDNMYYYHNEVTGETQWERPTGTAPAPTSVANSTSSSEFDDSSHEPAVSPPWEAYFDKRWKRWYFYNTKTQTATWNLEEANLPMQFMDC